MNTVKEMLLSILSVLLIVELGMDLLGYHTNVPPEKVKTIESLLLANNAHQ